MSGMPIPETMSNSRTTARISVPCRSQTRRVTLSILRATFCIAPMSVSTTFDRFTLGVRYLHTDRYGTLTRKEGLPADILVFALGVGGVVADSNPLLGDGFVARFVIAGDGGGVRLGVSAPAVTFLDVGFVPMRISTIVLLVGIVLLFIPIPPFATIAGILTILVALGMRFLGGN